MSDKKNIGAGFVVNTSGQFTAGQSDVIDVTGSDLADGDSITWSSSMGATFSPNPSTAGNGSSSTNYTAPASAGTDVITATNTTQGTSGTGAVIVVASGGGGGGGGSAAWTTDANVVATANAMNQISDFTSTAACAPVKAFQQAVVNAGGPSLTVDGGYGANTASANAQVASANGGGNVQPALTSGFPNCGGAAPPGPPAPVPPAPVQPASKNKIWWWIAGIIIAGGVAGLLYWAFGTQHGKDTLGMAGEKKTKKKKRKKK